MSISSKEFIEKIYDMQTLLSSVSGDHILEQIIKLGIEQLKYKISNNSSPHKKIKLKCPFANNVIIEIDNDIADLIKQLWRAKLKTCNSCQDSTPADYIFIEFCPVVDGDKFIDILISNYPYDDKLSKRILGIYTKYNWILKYNLDNIEINNLPIDPISSLSVRFHKSDYKIVFNRISEYLLLSNKKLKTKMPRN